jgi:transcriptional regulator with XRE-family HTH domain
MTRVPGRTISAAALRDWLDRQPRGTQAKLARKLEVSDQVIAQWLERNSIPHYMLEAVAAATGLDAQAIRESGKKAEQPVTAYRVRRRIGNLSREEQELVHHYRLASPSWQAGLRKLARLHPDHEKRDVRESMIAVLEMITAEPVADSRLGKEWKRPDRR